jgi:hypothetical protein
VNAKINNEGVASHPSPAEKAAARMRRDAQPDATPSRYERRGDATGEQRPAGEASSHARLLDALEARSI